MIEIPNIPIDVPNDRKLIIGTRTWIRDWTHCDIDPTPLVTHPDLGPPTRHPVDIVCDAANLSSIPDNTFGYLLSSEALEHWGHKVYSEVLKEWCRVVAPGGYIRVEVPDALAAFAEFIAAETVEDERALQQIIHAEQLGLERGIYWDVHFVSLTPRMLTQDFTNFGFEIIDVKRGYEVGWLRVDARKETL